MRKISVLSLLLVGGFSAAAQSLQDYKAAYEANFMDLKAGKEYVQALRRQKPLDKAELEKVSDAYTMVAVFYTLLGQQHLGEVEIPESCRNIDPRELKRLKMPLSDRRKDQLEYLIAQKANNPHKMAKYAKRLVFYPMPDNNMCDPVILGGVLHQTFEAGTLDDSKAFLADLAKLQEQITDPRVSAQIKSALEDGEGYVMLKEYEMDEE